MSQQPIQSWLTDTRMLQTIMSKAHYLNKLNFIVHQHLAEDLAPHCRVANYTVGRLKLITSSSVWASRLRFCIPTLLTNLQKHHAFSQLQHIELSIRPFYQPISQEINRKPNLSVENANLITATAKEVTDPKLQQALMRLAQKTRQR